MKNVIQPLSKNTRYAEAAAILDRLTQSHSTAQAEADRTAALLAARTSPTKDEDAVSAALNMLDSGTPARLGDMDALAAANAEARNRAGVLQQAINQQQAEMARLLSEFSGEQSNASRADHAAAVQGIADALKALGNALQAEADLRARIEAAGYQCHLESFQVPELGGIGALFDRDSVLSTHIRTAAAYVAYQHAELSDDPDKAVRVHLLADWPGVGMVTEVVTLAGRMARHLVRFGLAEPTSDKPRRVTKQMGYEA